MSDLSREILAWLFVAAILGLNVSAIPKFINELRFYALHHWDFRKESYSEVFLQDQFSQRYQFLPIGLVKLSLLAVRVGFFCAPFIAAWNGYRLGH